MTTTTSLRLQILEKMKVMLKEVRADVPVADPYGMDFKDVEIGPLGEASALKRYMIGIVPGREVKRDLYPFMDVTFTVAIEFRVTINKGDAAPLVMIERMLSNVQRVFYQNKAFIPGLVYDTKEVGNEVDLFTFGDKTPTGVLQVEVYYRHDHDDVRSYGGHTD